MKTPLQLHKLLSVVFGNGLEGKAIARCILLRLCNSAVQFVKYILAKNIAVFEENEDLHYKPVYGKVVAHFTVGHWLLESKFHALWKDALFAQCTPS